MRARKVLIRFVVRFLLPVAAAAAVPALAWAVNDHPPLPRPRPAIGGAVEKSRTSTVGEPADEAEKPSLDQDCLERLKQAGIEFEPVALSAAKNPACAIDTAVRIKSISTGASSAIRLPDAPTVSCR